eukprot:363324-Chlamydomonas_euryale.AAC.8
MASSTPCFLTYAAKRGVCEGANRCGWRSNRHLTLPHLPPPCRTGARRSAVVPFKAAEQPQGGRRRRGGTERVSCRGARCA